MEKKKVLIIDDEENFCKLVKKNIERTGEFEVHTATNGEEGIRLVREIKPNLVLLDIVMPEMDGADVATQIRDDKSIEDTPIVFLTAIIREEESDSQPSFTRGYALLSKTATIKELIACIKENVREGAQP
jgi:two-component system alkaline phosphatase synthesis response regulator PhoP